MTYSISADAIDEYIEIGEFSGSVALEIFCYTVVKKFEHENLPLPNAAEIERIEG